MGRINVAELARGVRRVDGMRRIAVPAGDYAMIETDAGGYKMWRSEGPTFVLTATEAGHLHQR